MKWAAIASVAALTMTAPPGAAQWSTARGTTPDTGVAQCVMVSTQGSQEVRLLKFVDDELYYVHIVIGRLDVPGSTRYEVPVTFDRGRTWRLSAVGARGDGGLLADMPAADFHLFLNDVRIHNRVQLDLSSIGYNNWDMTLGGSNAAGDAFLHCVPELS